MKKETEGHRIKIMVSNIELIEARSELITLKTAAEIRLEEKIGKTEKKSMDKLSDSLDIAITAIEILLARGNGDIKGESVIPAPNCYTMKMKEEK